MTRIILRFLVVTVIGLLVLDSLQSEAQQQKPLMAFYTFMPLIFSSNSRYDHKQPQPYSAPLDRPETLKSQGEQGAAAKEYQSPSRKKKINQFPGDFARREEERCLNVIDRLQAALDTSDDNLILVSDLDETSVQKTWQYGMKNTRTNQDISPAIQAQNNCFQLITSKINYGDSDRRLMIIYTTARNRTNSNQFVPVHHNGFDLFVLNKHVRHKDELHTFLMPPPEIFILKNGGQIEEWGSPFERPFVHVNELLEDWVEDDYDDLLTKNPSLVDFDNTYREDVTSLDLLNISKTAHKKRTTVESIVTRIDPGRFFITYMYRLDSISIYNKLLNKGLSMRVAVTYLMKRHPRFFEKKVHLVVFGNGMKDMPMIRMDMEGDVYGLFDYHLRRLLRKRESELAVMLGVPILSRYQLARMWLVSVMPEGMRRTIKEESTDVYQYTKHQKVVEARSSGLTGLLEAMIPYLPSGYTR